MNKQQAFTFIEILVVVTIIGLLTAAGSVSYSQFIKQSRDAKRKVDIEQIRAAIEMYRSNNGSYPLNGSGVDKVDVTTCSTSGLTDSSLNTYLSKTPNDPKCNNTPSVKYYYQSAGPTYSIGANLEGTIGTVCAAGGCGTKDCNYCLGPYGQTN